MIGSRARVLHLLATANVGGAQGSATELMLRMDRSRFELEAVSLGHGPAIQRMRGHGLRVTVLDEPDDRLAVRQLAAHLRDRAVDILHAHMYRAELLGARAARLAGTRLVVATVHSSRVRSPSDVAALAAVTPLIDRLIVPSEAIAAKIRHEGRGAAEISVIPNGVDLDRFAAHRSSAEVAAVRASLGIPADDFLIGVVARLEAEKGHRHLLAAWPAIAHAVPGAWLVLVGDGSLTDALRAQARALPPAVNGRVVFAGGRTEIPALTESLDLAVLPSIREAQGIALLEAMAAGRPVIASSVGGIPETIRDGVDGLLVSPANPEALARAVIRLARSGAARTRLAAAGRRRVEDRFDITEAVQRVAAIYDDEVGRTERALRAVRALSSAG